MGNVDFNEHPGYGVEPLLIWIVIRLRIWTADVVPHF